MGLEFVTSIQGIQICAMGLKSLMIVFIAVNVPPFMVWLERRAPALMQRRKGPNRVGFFGLRLWGLLQSLADVIKLIFKEESVPASGSKFFYHMSPLFCLVPALLVLASVPFGPDMFLFDQTISLNIINLNVGLFFVLAVSGVSVYGVSLAGWACGGKFPLLGSLRACAQMLSYEIPMGLSLIPLVLIYDTLDLHQMVLAQNHIWSWGVVLSPISFFIFLITMFAETNRVPFDLAEGESELIAGFHTEYGSAKFTIFFLSEYVSMFALSCLCTALFFGGWQIPFVSHELLVNVFGHQNLVSLFCFVFFLIKSFFFMWLYVWVRWTIPRFRYDQLMKMSWQFLLPLSLGNIFITALVLSLRF